MNPEQDVFDEVESDEFALAVNIASGRDTFLRLSQASPSFKRLTTVACTSDGRDKIMARINALATEVPDPQFENPRDVALSAYLLALLNSDKELAVLAAGVIRRVPQCWWAKDVVDLVAKSNPPTAHGKVFTISGLGGVGSGMAAMIAKIHDSQSWLVLSDVQLPMAGTVQNPQVSTRRVTPVAEIYRIMASQVSCTRTTTRQTTLV